MDLGYWNDDGTAADGSLLAFALRERRLRKCLDAAIAARLVKALTGHGGLRWHPFAA